MIKVYCFGNEYVEGDEIAKVLARKIKTYKEFEFIEADNPTEILEAKNTIWILDVVKGLKKVQEISIQDLEHHSSLTVHDLDLGFYLGLMKASGKIKEARILGLPYGFTDKENLEKAVLKILETS